MFSLKYVAITLLTLNWFVMALRLPASTLKLQSATKPQFTIAKTPKNTLGFEKNPYRVKLAARDQIITGSGDNVVDDFPITASTPTGFNPDVQAQQPVPKWLKDFTGLSEWPGMDPPYIPLDFIKLEEIPDIAPYPQGVCPLTRGTCSFDCYKCVEPDDVFTCPKLSQTFDDGPSPATPKLLSHLQGKSSFFTLGVNVVRYPEIYHSIQKKGHLLGSHTWSHKFLPSLTNEQVIAQLEWSIWAMNATGNHLPKWFRPPYGGIDNRIRHILRKFGLQAALWDHDTFDWQLLNPSMNRTQDQILADVKQWMSKSNPPMGLILEHDGAIQTVNAGIEVRNLIGEDQWTVAQCKGGAEYIRVFDPM